MNNMIPLKPEKISARDAVGYDVAEVEQVEVITVHREDKEVRTTRLKPAHPEINIRSLPVLEALSRATEEKMKPLSLRSNDRLEIDLDEEGKRFITRVYSVRPKISSVSSSNSTELACEEEYFGPASYYAHGLFKRIPEHFSRGEYMVLAATDFTALVIYNSWPENQIIWKDPNAKIIYEFLIARFMVQTNKAVMQAKFKINREVPALPDDFVDHPDPDLQLKDYQKAALAFIMQDGASALWMKQGLGKTPTALHKIFTEAKRTRQGKYGKPRMMRVLVVCPKQVRKNWRNECERFATVPGKIVILRGGRIRRINGLIDATREESDCAFSLAICSYESVENTWQALSEVAWDLVILDESHCIKNPNSQRSKACVRKLRDMARRRLILTGTPYGNHQLDLFPQFEFLGEGLSGFLSYKNFKSFHSKSKKMGAWEKLLEMTNIPLLRERVSRVAFTLNKEEAGVKLPDKVYDIYEVEPTPNQRKIYAKLQNELRAEIEADKTCTVEHILTKLLRLAQVASGYVKYDDVFDEHTGEVLRKGSVEQISGGNPKVDAIIDMIREDMENDPNGKIVIWSCFDECVRVLSERLAQENICHVGYKQEIVDQYRKNGADDAAEEFNKNPECKVFIGNPASGGSGLNLVGYDFSNPDNDQGTYCNHVIYFCKNWSFLQRSQSEDRSAERLSSKCNVRITDLQCEDLDIDEEIRVRVIGKKKAAAQIQDLKDLLQRVLDTDSLLEEN